MKVVVEGHRYILKSQEGTNNQEIQFIQGVMEEDGTGLWMAMDGTTDEEVLEMLIDRRTHFQKEIYASKENACAITKLEEALYWLENEGRDQKRKESKKDN